MTIARIEAEEALIVDATEAIAEAMHAADVDASRLADLLSMRRRRVTRMLRGDLSVRDLAAALDVLGRRVEMVVTGHAEPDRISAVEGRRIVEQADSHPRRDLVYTLAEVTSDLDSESGAGGGMWWHLSRALAIVDAIPDLRADRQ